MPYELAGNNLELSDSCLQSDDCTVFFFTVSDTYQPIGFVETASPVVSLSWSKKGKVREIWTLSTYNTHKLNNIE